MAQVYSLSLGHLGRHRFLYHGSLDEEGLGDLLHPVFYPGWESEGAHCRNNPKSQRGMDDSVGRNLTMAEWGFLTPGQHLIHDRDPKFCSAFQETLKAADITPITLPPRSPNVNAHAERWVRSVKEEVLARLILFGEDALRQALKEYDTHYHQERNHQGKGNALLMPRARKEGWDTNPIHSHERLGGLLKFHYRKAA